jgi:hypothetical protein
MDNKNLPKMPSIEIKKMSLTREVTSVVLKATTKCEKGFSCLAGSNESLCWVKYFNRYYFVEIKPQAADCCPYVFVYSNATYCLCPTRNEIYNRSQI